MRVDHLLGSAIVLSVWSGACSNTPTHSVKTPMVQEQAAPASASSGIATTQPATGSPTPMASSAPASSSTGAAQNTATSDLANVDAAVLAAQSWLKLVDSAKYDESWHAAAAVFQHGVSEAEWSTAATKALSPLGKLRSRHLRSAAYETSLPGAPDGKYVVIRFDANFENNARALETITPMQGEDGAWKVAGYFVK